MMDAREVGEPTALDTYARSKSGAHRVTYADKLLVSGGPGPLDETLREAVRSHQPYLLAAACVLKPPMKWLAFMVKRTRAREIPVSMLAANVASFLGKHPAKDGPAFEWILAQVVVPPIIRLKQKKEDE